MVTEYLKNFFTRLGLLMGLVMYLSYGIPTGEWESPWLVGVAAFVGVFLPFFVRLSDTFEAKAIRITGSIFVGKLARFAWQCAFNGFAIAALLTGGIIYAGDLAAVGGPVGATALMSLASQGTQYLMIELGNRNIGNRYLNVILALSFNIIVGALAALGYEIFQVLFVVVGVVLGTIGALWSGMTDILSLIAPRGGVGVFFGTFNPVHTSHLRILREFIAKRQLERVYLHPTVVPAFYQGLLDEGVITIDRYVDGMRFYRLTGHSNFHMNYFPTGQSFYEAENRVAMLRAALEDGGLSDRVEVLFEPGIYQRYGFGGIVREIRRRHPNARLHGLHGSDAGGSIVRMIYDLNRVWAMAAIRRDEVSATAIREGGVGMTSSTVEAIRQTLRDSSEKTRGAMLRFGSREYTYCSNRLIPAVASGLSLSAREAVEQKED
ncbi:MAG: hypothetical protein LBJ02_08685 [Bifidobacteriaceae bacterium]|nr:hypothetical protein [Bifidobacteriaceae bacterium]